MLEFNILKGQYLNRLDKNVVSADTTDLKVQFELTADFTGTITVWWRRSDVNNTYTSTLAADGTCTIPAEALAATDKAVYGPYDHDVFVSISDTGRTTTNECKLTVQRSAFSTNATPGTGGNPTAYEELVEQFDELKADNQTFKDDMTEQQKTFESTVTENVDNIRYVVETETAPPIIEEASGAEITLDDSAYRQVRGLNLYGYSKQTQTTGAQLIPDKITTGTASGVKMTLNSDGSFTLNGTNTGGDKLGLYFVGGHGSTTEFLPTGNYFYKVDGLNEGDYCIVRGTDFESINSNPVNISQHNITQLGIAVSPGTTYNNVKIYPMLNAGSSALPWEPYSGGYASPSPDWAQPITSVGDGGSVTVNSAGANLIDVSKKAINQANNGIAVKALGDGTFSYSGTAGAGNVNVWLAGDWSSTKEVIHLREGEYTALIDEAIYVNDEALVNPGSKIEAPSNGIPITGVRAPQASTGTYYNKTIYPMISRGSTPLPWQPYAAPSSALIALTDSLRGIPVTSGGTYTDDSGQQWIADYIYRRQTDGKWMIWRNCIEVLIDGSVAWTYSYQNDTIIQFVNYSVIRKDPPSLPSNLISEVGVGDHLIEGAWIYDVNSLVLCLKKILLSQETKEGVRQWCEENPFHVVYQLATPTVEELPDDVQTELNRLMTYNLHTDMWNNDGAFMNLKYVADTKTWINNKIAGISTAMLSQN